MNLYRLDYEAPSGACEAVTDLFGPVLIRQYARARERARLAGADGSVIRITRITGAGSLKIVARYSGETGRFHKA